MIEAQTMLELACDLAIWFEKPTTDPASKALIDRAINVLRASTAAAQPVAWTNKAQLSFLDDPACADIPMAMWSKTSPTSPIPLYAALPAVQPDGVIFTVEDAWQELVHKDDRTSPEEYPDMALVTSDELANFMRRYALHKRNGSAVQPDGLREQIARIIDARPFEMDAEYSNKFTRKGIARALEKADAVLSLSRPDGNTP